MRAIWDGEDYDWPAAKRFTPNPCSEIKVESLESKALRMRDSFEKFLGAYRELNKKEGVKVTFLMKDDMVLTIDELGLIKTFLNNVGAIKITETIKRDL